MDQSFLNKLYESHKDSQACPSPAVVASFYTALLGTLFPDFSETAFDSREDLAAHLEGLKATLNGLLYKYPHTEDEACGKIAKDFFGLLPSVHDRLLQDVRAMYEGDPAARSEREVIRTYPGFFAIAAYRVAHSLFTLGGCDLARIITEHAHSHTGIDIHPGAVIGNYFCIDHGTGIVIGETTVIGEHVKIYQGVTLGALSVNKEDATQKRHPTIEDGVVIYAGATILGGNTVVGEGSVIGGNVWITRSVPARSKIYYQARMHHDDTDDMDVVVFKGQTK